MGNHLTIKITSTNHPGLKLFWYMFFTICPQFYFLQLFAINLENKTTLFVFEEGINTIDSNDQIKIKLNFVIDEEYLIYYTLRSAIKGNFSSDLYRNDIIKFKDFALRLSKDSCRLILKKRYDPTNISKMDSDLSVFLKKLNASPEFKKILEQTKNYSEQCEKQWKENYNKTSKYINEITGLKLDKTFTIYITHPSLRNGEYLGSNKIEWGHIEEWPNYITIYLWHEILHSYFTYTRIDHAIIELISDEELRHILNNEIYPPFVGHHRLKKIKEKLLPKWKVYLKSENKNINKFRRKMVKRYFFFFIF